MKSFIESGLPSATANLLVAFLIATLWVALFLLNNWFFNAFQFAQNMINWVFLPAAIRLLAVLIAGWVGALGLFVGSLVAMLITHQSTYDLQILVLFAFLSALAPLAALLCCAWGLRLHRRLEGLSGANLFVLSIVSAFFVAVPHNIAFYLLGLRSNVLDGIGPMFIGDLIGTLLVLYIVRSIMPPSKTPPNQAFS